MKKKTIAKVLKFLINWGAILYIVYYCTKTGIAFYDKYGWVGAVVWVFVLVLLIVIAAMIFKLLDHLDNIINEKEND
jgi:uncharacterized protein YebE (UPF0316 family)